MELKGQVAFIRCCRCMRQKKTKQVIYIARWLLSNLRVLSYSVSFGVEMYIRSEIKMIYF